MRGLQVTALARVTAQEMLRDRLLYHGAVLAAALLAVAYLAGQLTFVNHARLVTDFGYSAFQVSCNLMATLLAAVMLPRELERRTAYLTLSKPIHRYEFLLGKWAGLILVLTLNALVLSAVYIGSILAVGGNVHTTLAQSLALGWMEAVVLSGVALFFSVWTTPSLSISLALGVYLIGTNVSQFRFLATKAASNVSKAVFEVIAAVFPNLEHFHVGTQLTYGLPIPWMHFLLALGYGVWVASFTVGLSCVIFERREL